MLEQIGFKQTLYLHIKSKEKLLTVSQKVLLDFCWGKN